MKFILVRIFFLFLVLIPLKSNPTTNTLAYEIGQEFNKELFCMAKNVYYEAGSEPYEGKLAVAQVTMNRTHSSSFPKKVCEVVYQKVNNIYQFSWVGENHKDITNKYAWEESLIVARKALTENKLHDIIYKTKAMYFHNTSVQTDWKLKYVAKIGNHLFYTKT